MRIPALVRLEGTQAWWLHFQKSASTHEKWKPPCPPSLGRGTPVKGFCVMHHALQKALRRWVAACATCARSGKVAQLDASHLEISGSEYSSSFVYGRGFPGPPKLDGGRLEECSQTKASFARARSNVSRCAPTSIARKWRTRRPPRGRAGELALGRRFRILCTSGTRMSALGLFDRSDHCCERCQPARGTSRVRGMCDVGSG